VAVGAPRDATDEAPNEAAETTGAKIPVTETADKPAQEPSGVQSAEPVEITFIQTGGDYQDRYVKLAELYNASQTGVVLSVLDAPGDNYDQVMQSYFATDLSTAPTIFTDVPSATSIYHDFKAEITDSAAAGLMPESVVNTLSVDGKLYGLASTIQGYGIIYNKDLFAQAGVDANSIVDMNSLADACKVLEGQAGISHAMGFGAENFFLFMHPFNYGVAVDANWRDNLDAVDNGGATFQGMDSAVAWAEGMAALKPYTNGGADYYDDNILKFSMGEYAMIFQGDWIQGSLDANEPEFEYGMIPLPVKGNKGLAVSAAGEWCVNRHAGAAQQAAAVEFLDWIYKRAGKTIRCG
jgi:raffinose/stachyose/melibiose transport system substrate-binding protein